jgi:predicted DNA-binding protein
MVVSRRLKRVQVLLPTDSYQILQQLAARTNQSVSALVRETIEEQLIQHMRARQKEEALARLCSGDAPVEDWGLMERQIERRWEQCQPDESKR